MHGAASNIIARFTCCMQEMKQNASSMQWADTTGPASKAQALGLQGKTHVMLALGKSKPEPARVLRAQIGGVCLMNEQYKMADWLNKRGAHLPGHAHPLKVLAPAISAFCCACTQHACWVSWPYCLHCCALAFAGHALIVTSLADCVAVFFRKAGASSLGRWRCPGLSGMPSLLLYSVCATTWSVASANRPCGGPCD